MSNSEIDRFKADLQTDAELLKALSEAGSGIGQVLEFARTRGYDITLDDVRSYLHAHTGHELTDDQLNELSGAGQVHTHSNINTNTNVSSTAEVSTNVVQSTNAVVQTNVVVAAVVFP